MSLVEPSWPNKTARQILKAYSREQTRLSNRNCLGP